MPITTYFGAPGSGKTYELVNRVMVEAYKAGRSIFHNVPGIDPAAWRAEFGDDGGELVYVDDDWFVDDKNFPSSDEEFAEGVGVLKGGELIVCDEASTIFPKGTGRNSRVSARLDAFFRKHRHFTGDVTGVDGKTQRIACDIYVATQDSASLHTTLLHLCHLRVDFEKLDSMFGKNAYRATVYKSHRATKANRIKKPLIRWTNTKGFVRYHSFAGGEQAGVAKTEKTANAWGLKQTMIAVFAVIALPTSIYFAVTTVADVFDPKARIAASSGGSPVAAQNQPLVPAGADRPDFDARAALDGQCVQFLINEDDGTYFDGEEWKPFIAVGDRYLLDGCWLNSLG